MRVCRGQLTLLAFFPPDRLEFKMFLAFYRTVFLGGQADGVCNYMKDGLMGLVTYRSALKPDPHLANHQWLMLRLQREGGSWCFLIGGWLLPPGGIQTQDHPVVLSTLVFPIGL